MIYFNNTSVDICLREGLLTIANKQNELLVGIKLQHLLKVSLSKTDLTIHYVIKKASNVMKVKSVVVKGTEEDIQSLHYNIEEKLQGRPKKLLVIINPNSGKKKGVKIYEKYVAPLFQLCGVQADVIVTNKRKQATEIVQNYNLSQIDGIVTVGGDGLYCECMNGLVTRVQRDNNINFHSHDSNLVSASLPIGLIPAGSGDVVVQYLHGTRCARTAALHILLGSHVHSNVVSVHEGRHLLSYAALILGFGLFGDIMNDCEQFRWMGPSRYNVIPVGSMMKRREFDVEIEYHPYKNNKETTRSRVVGRQISLPNGFFPGQRFSRKERTKSTSDVSSQGINNSECIKNEERVYAVDSHPIMMKEQGGKMVPNFGQASLMVYTTRTCPLLDHISQLKKVKNEEPDCYDYKFVSKHEVSSYKVKLLNATTTDSGSKKVLQKDYYLNCDGEVLRLTQPDFNVKLHRKAVTFFGNVTAD